MSLLKIAYRILCYIPISLLLLYGILELYGKLFLGQFFYYRNPLNNTEIKFVNIFVVLYFCSLYSAIFWMIAAVLRGMIKKYNAEKISDKIGILGFILSIGFFYFD